MMPIEKDVYCVNILVQDVQQLKDVIVQVISSVKQILLIVINLQDYILQIIIHVAHVHSLVKHVQVQLLIVKLVDMDQNLEPKIDIVDVKMVTMLKVNNV